ncbi:MAG: flagellar type III secretion system pore protein FliP [Firmicutes bacterium]|nr:flagellar type III secretion system pore protein FliP [Bacillota bacterium]
MALNRATKLCFAIGLVLFLLLAIKGVACAQPIAPPWLDLDFIGEQEPEGVALTLQILFLLTILSLAPALMIMLTSFTRIVVVLSFVRSALATQNMPPNQVIIALALFLTFFTMNPYWQQINETSLQPYLQGDLPYEEAVVQAAEPVRDFMFRQTKERDLALIVSLAGLERPRGPEDIPTYALIPAFITSELKTAFQIGFLIYIPFLVIDMVVASTLMSMGMLMLPPVMISLPFKVLLFVLVDGWHLVVRSLVLGFN